MELSVILTCLNQEKVLNNSVQRIKEVLDPTKIKYEIVIVDDGSTDSTNLIIKNLMKKYRNVKSLTHKHNFGRGRAVSNGFKSAKGKFVGFLDTDLELPPEYIPLFFKKLSEGYQVATYHRKYKHNLRGITRAFMSYGYHLLVKLLLNVNLRDTESGFKFFNKESISDLLDEIKEDRWFWDTEIMVRSYLKKLRIIEIPLKYVPNKSTGSTVNLVSDSFDYFKKLVKFRGIVKKIRNSQPGFTHSSDL